MQRLILKTIVFLTVLFTLYQYRYKVMNYVLGFGLIRKFAVMFSMNFPSVREKFIKQAFR